MGKLDGKVALVTGGSRGIGAAIVRTFAREGASVVVNYHTSPEAAQSIVDEISGAGGIAVALQGNVARREDAERLVSETITRFGHLDILVNNAGINRDRALANLSDEHWDEVLDVNLKGCFHTTRAAAGQFRRQRSGVVINMSSVVAQTGNIGQANYVAAKAGIIGFTRAAALELARFGVTVNAICPGFIETDMTAALPDKVRQAMLERVPLGRPGTPDDVARAALFLAADAPYITAQSINVNGGLHT